MVVYVLTLLFIINNPLASYGCSAASCTGNGLNVSVPPPPPEPISATIKKNRKNTEVHK